MVFEVKTFYFLFTSTGNNCAAKKNCAAKVFRSKCRVG